MPRLGLHSPTLERRACDLAEEIGSDLQYFTLLSNLTTLRDRCQFALGSGGDLAARYLDLPFAAVSFYGQGSGLRSVLQTLLLYDEVCYTLVGSEQLAQIRAVVHILGVEREWQMIFRANADRLDAGQSRRLDEKDEPAMHALAERCDMFAFAANALEKGPYFGVYRKSVLAAMAGTHLCVLDTAEVGNVVTDSGYRRQGLASMALSGLVRFLSDAGRTVFLQVFASNQPAIALYEKLGFERAGAMYLVRFELERGR